MAKIYDRYKKCHIEMHEEQNSIINFLYNNWFGEALLYLIVSRPIFSKLYSIYYKSRLSKHKIKKFITKNNLNVQSVERYNTFNEFFTRQDTSFKIDISPLDLISPAQSKLYVHKIGKNTDKLTIKGVKYTVSEILFNRPIAEKFIGGYCLVFRLSLTDYHRYIFIDDMSINVSYDLKGYLHTVRDEASKYKVYATNCRHISTWKSKHLGDICIVEVGALTVGKIINHKVINARKGDEKGYFEYGGSTILVFIEKGRVNIDKDIIEQSKLGIETSVNIGEKIGDILRN